MIGPHRALGPACYIYEKVDGLSGAALLRHGVPHRAGQDIARARVLVQRLLLSRERRDDRHLQLDLVLEARNGDALRAARGEERQVEHRATKRCCLVLGGMRVDVLRVVDENGVDLREC